MEDVSAPEDWLPSQPSLKALDANLRCLICYDFFVAPVILTTCGHAYCSECIREALETKKDCPVCHKPANDVNLKRVPVLEDLVHNFQAARTGLLAMVRDAGRAASPPVSRGLKRKASSEATATATYGAKGKMRAVEEEDSLEIIEPDAEVDCPLCARRVPQLQINAHIDRGCRDNKTSDWKGVFGATAKPRSIIGVDKPLPKVSLSKPKEIKEWLEDHGLPTDGSREAMLDRVQMWIRLVNANCDREVKSQATASVLRKKLLRTELERKSVRPEVDKSHQTVYAAQFKELAASFRQRVAQQPDPRNDGSTIIDLDSVVEPRHAPHPRPGLSESEAGADAPPTSLEPLRPEQRSATDSDDGDSEIDEPPLTTQLERAEVDVEEQEDLGDSIEPLDPLPVYKKPRPPRRARSPFDPMPPPPSQRERTIPHVIVI